jgi:hypothetical protein
VDLCYAALCTQSFTLDSSRLASRLHHRLLQLQPRRQRKSARTIWTRSRLVLHRRDPIKRQTIAPFFMGRHNLKPFFTLLRFHLPDVKLLVDIGANKGLVSSRWLELWRPELNQTARQHVDFVMQYVKDNAPADTWDRWCGVTDMCDQPNLIERAMLDEYAPVTKHNSSSNQHKRVASDQFELYSFEPSPHLYQMQQHYISTRA